MTRSEMLSMAGRLEQFARRLNRSSCKKDKADAVLSLTIAGVYYDAAGENDSGPGRIVKDALRTEPSIAAA